MVKTVSTSTDKSSDEDANFLQSCRDRREFCFAKRTVHDTPTTARKLTVSPFPIYRVNEYVSYGRRFAKQNFGRPYRCGGTRLRIYRKTVRLKHKKQIAPTVVVGAILACVIFKYYFNPLSAVPRGYRRSTFYAASASRSFPWGFSARRQICIFSDVCT